MGLIGGIAGSMKIQDTHIKKIVLPYKETQDRHLRLWLSRSAIERQIVVSFMAE